MGIRNQSVPLPMSIIHREGWGKKNDGAIHLSNGAPYRNFTHTPSLWELSKSVDGDKCKDLIYLVDKRINCCYLPQAQTGGRGGLLLLFYAGGRLPGRGRAPGTLTDERGRACQDPVIGNSKPERAEAIILPSLMCPVTGRHT